MKDYNQIESMCMNCLKQMAQAGGVCEHCGFDNSSPKSPHHLPPRTILAGKFMTGRVLGEGGFGITYMGYDLNLDCRVAIKEYYPAGFVSRETTVRNTVTFLTGMNQDFYQTGMEKFLNEAKALAKFSELPGIARVRDFFQENGTAYIVMDYIEGNTLAEELSKRGGPLPVDEVLAKMEPLIRSLSVVHSSGIIHRDISPDNIMQNTRGELKLLDFGAARELASNQKSVAVMLKPGYAPEEQYRTKGEQGPWTDCYALCATIYKLITGVTPPEALERMAEDKLIPPSQLGVNLNPGAEHALLMGLAVKPEHRFKSMDALYNALYAGSVSYVEPAIPQKTVPVQKTIPIQQSIEQHPTPQKAQTAKKKAPIGLIAGIGAAVVVVIVALVLLLQPRPSREAVGDPVSVGETPAPSAGFPSPAPSDDGSLSIDATPEPTPWDAPSDLGTEGMPTGTGKITVPDFNTFSGFSPDDTVRGSDGSVTYRYQMDVVNEDVLIQYYLMLYYDDSMLLGYAPMDENLFYVKQAGGGYLLFNYDEQDEMLEIVVPAGVDMQTFETSVTYYYLNSNGLNYEMWLELSDDDYSDRGINFSGNSPGNIMSNCVTATQGEWLYFCDVNDFGYLYRASFNTGDVELLLAESLSVSSLNVQGDYVYFTCYESGTAWSYALYRCGTTPGSSKELLYRGADTAAVIGRYIYLYDWQENMLKRMSKWGGEAEPVFKECGAFIVTGAGIYIAHSNGEGIYFMYHNDMYHAEKITDESAFKMLLCGDYLYFIPLGADKCIYRIGADGSGPKTQITTMGAWKMNWDGDGLYVISEDFQLYRMNMDGKSAVKLLNYCDEPVIHNSKDYFALFYRGADWSDPLMLFDWAKLEGVRFPK